jgi:DNA mismatch repair protein MutS2
VNGNTFRVLEFEAIRALLLSQAGSARGKAHLEALTPAHTVADVRGRLLRTREAVALLRGLGRQPYHDLPDVDAVLAAARVEGLHLDPPALSEVASFIEGGVEIARRVAVAPSSPSLARRAAEVADTTAVAQRIRRAILPSGEVADDASPKLAETRRALVRLRAQLQSVMEGFLRAKDADRLLQDRLITTRNDRYVLLVKAEHRGAMPGIIHGGSGSGASLFVEPMPAVELNNDIVALGDEERQEVVRILRELTDQVRDRADELAHAAEVLGELDAAQAAALLARDMEANEPEIADEGRLDLELIDARHPLLMPVLTERLGLPRRTRREPVPVSVRIGFGQPVLVISGPNTGGKTVALKTVGLLALMAQHGLFVPAGPGSLLPVFRSVYADIGDEQSIAADLSTFSAHLATLVEMTRGLERPGLVLLDEVGAGTDPGEGGALGVAIVEHFRSRGAMVMATTHHGLLKSYAQSTPDVACASFGYDPQTYEPTYRLALGVAGRSLAFEMADRLGLPPAVVQDARQRLSAKEAQAEALLKTLEEDRARIVRDREELEEARRALDVERAEVMAAERQIEARKRSELETFARDLRKRAEEAARKAADAVQAAVQRLETSRRPSVAAVAKVRTEAVREIREAHEEALHEEAALLAPEPEPPALPLAVGARVRLRTLGVVGEVLSLPERGEAEVAVSGKRLKVPRGELLVVGSAPAGGAREAPRTPRVAAEASMSARRANVPAEINLVGLTVEEALPRVDKLLDEAIRSERTQVRVIHGFGSGRLRSAVADLLRDHPLVASFRAGQSGEGGGGATVVELKD